MIISGSICKPWRIEIANHSQDACERQSYPAAIKEVWIAPKGRVISIREQNIREDKGRQDEEKGAANNQAFCRHADYQRKTVIIQNLPL